jgi:hypothetical protein
MLKTVLLVLLAANGALWAARQGWLGQHDDAATRDPQRLTRQVNPALVKVLTPADAAAVLAAADARCVEAGPFRGAEAGQAERALRELALPADTWQALSSGTHAGFMLYIGKFASREAVQNKLEELRRHRTSGEILSEDPEWRWGVNLGRYDERADAEKAITVLQSRGVRTAKIVPVRAGPRQVRLRVPKADAALRARLAELGLPGGAAFAACAGAGTASGTAKAASAASAASRPATAGSGAAVAVSRSASALAAAPSAPAAAASGAAPAGRSAAAASAAASTAASR